jgi:putative salt-induced outer membrane protein YdiY
MAAPLAVTAQEAEESWQPAPPMPDDFDWIQLTSGEWLKGEIIAMFDESLDFDSKELDDLTLDFSDIQQIRSARVFQVAFLDDIVATGQVLMDGESVRVIGEEEYSSTRSQVLSITAGGARERDLWSGKLSAGLNFQSGNTNQTDFSASANFRRRSPKNRIRIDYTGNFSETETTTTEDNEPVTTTTTTADNQRLTASWNRFLSDRFYITPVAGEYYRDPFQNIDSRWALSVGLGYDLVDTAKVDWSIDGGVGYQKTTFEEVPVDDATSQDSPALVLGTDYENKLTKWVEYFFRFDFSIVNEESGKYTHHLETGFEFDLWGDFDFDITWVWDRIQEPQEKGDGIIPEQDDFRTSFLIGLSF